MRKYTQRTQARGEITGRTTKRIAVAFDDKQFASIRALAKPNESFGAAVRRLCAIAIKAEARAR